MAHRSSGINMVAEALQTLRDKKETLVTEAEVFRLESEISALELCSRLAEGHGDFVDPRGGLFDAPGFLPGGAHGGFGFGTLTRPEDRAHGDNFPWWQTEQEIAAIRGAARIVSETDEIAISALDNITNYILGEEGFVFTCIPTNGDDKLAATCQAVIDQFLEDNDWAGDMDREVVKRSMIDGEPFISLSEWRGGIRARLEEPDWITEPNNKRDLEDHLGFPSLDWKYGIATEIGDVSKVHGYFVQRFSDTGTDWDVFEPGQMVHLKLNVVRNVKRGMSDMFAVNSNLSRAGKVVSNSAVGAAVQAGIAYIVEHAPNVTNTDIVDLRSANETASFNQPRQHGSTINRSIQDRPPGEVKHIGANNKYHAGPMGGPKGTSYIEVAQAVFRIVGARWNMPEYMISGDASNANFASTLVSESPFVKSTLTRQGFYKRAFVNMLWKVIAMARSMGKIPHTVSMESLRRMIDIDAKAPDISVRDKMQDHAIRKDQVAMGALSLRSFAEEAEIDFDQELELGAKPMDLGVAVADVPQSVNNPMASSDGMSVASQFTANAEDTVDDSDTTALNGAQITAAKDLLANVSAGTTADLVAVELLSALGIEPSKAVEMVAAAKGVSKATDTASSALAAALESVESTEEAKAILREVYP